MQARPDTGRPHPLACPLSHGACRQTRKPRAIATASPAGPRRHAIRPRHGFVPSPAAVPPPPTFTPARLRALCPPSALSAVKLPTASPATPDKARSPRLARLVQSRAGVNRKRLNITAHYTKQASRCAWLRFMACRCRALRVRVMVGYVSRPGPDKGYSGLLRCVCLFRRCALGGVETPAPPCRSGETLSPPSQNIKTRG